MEGCGTDCLCPRFARDHSSLDGDGSQTADLFLQWPEHATDRCGWGADSANRWLKRCPTHLRLLTRATRNAEQISKAPERPSYARFSCFLLLHVLVLLKRPDLQASR